MATRRPTAAARKPVDIKLSDKQKKALSSLADIVIFGGGNGGGKSFTLRCSALRPEYLTTPGCASVLFGQVSQAPALVRVASVMSKGADARRR